MKQKHIKHDWLYPAGHDDRHKANVNFREDRKHNVTRNQAISMLQALLVGIVLLGMAAETIGQPSRPAPSEANSRVHNGDAPASENERAGESNDQDRGGDDDRVVETPPGTETAEDRERDRVANTGPVRRVVNGDRVILAFNDVSVEQTIPFIVETTGKVVMPINLQALQGRRITLVNDEPVDREVALDMLFTAFRLNQVGVIEKDDVIIIDQLADIPRLGDLPVLYARDDVMQRRDRGTHVIKIFALRNANAEGVGEQIMETLPDYATLTVDPNSNQIVLVGDIGLAQQMQKLIDELDKNYVNVRTQTFRLAHADAFEVQENILDLFEVTDAQRTQRRATQQRGQAARRGAAQQPTAATTIGPYVEMRVTVNQHRNSVTVSAEPDTVEQISQLIATEWDLPRPAGTAKVYTLTYTDPVRVREMLHEIVGQSGAAGGRGGGQARGGGGGGDVGQTIRGIYRIDAYEDTGRLVVLSKTQEALDFLDHLIDQIDQPSDIGLPVVYELKHADAVSLSEELNALLQEAGAGSDIPGRRRGLSGQMGFGGTGGTGRGGAGAQTGQAGMTREGAEAGRITFPWQGRTRDDRGPVSPIIGTSRIVPIVRQNALAILAPPPMQERMLELVEAFDKPGRQVMISAVIAEVTMTDSLSLGLRLSSSDDIGGRFPDFGIQAGGQFSATEEGIFGSLFDTSVLDVNFNINAFFQALARENAVRILQQPRIFTSDNQEAEFFDGQELSVPVGTFTDIQGGLTQDFDRREVGVRLNARPRITVEGDVDLEIILELSSVVPGTLGDRVVFDRRQTSTQVIVRDGQTIVLSGIMREQESEIRRKFPILGDIPILDLIFSSRDTEIEQAELVAFITPTIVERPSANDENFNVRERQRLEELARPLKEIDAAPERLRERIIHPGQQRPGDTPPVREDDDAAQRPDDDGVFNPLQQ